MRHPRTRMLQNQILFHDALKLYSIFNCLLNKIIPFLFQMGVNPVGDKIIEAFLPRKGSGNGFRNKITFQQFVKTFAVFRPIHKSEADNPSLPNSKQNKVLFAILMKHD